MKTKTIILLLAVVASASFLLGAKVKLKFSYLPAEVNKTVSITQIELTCARAGFRAAEPITINGVARKKKIVIAHIHAIDIKPKNRHISILAEVRRAPKTKLTDAEIGVVCRAVIKEARRRLHNARWVKKLSTELPADCPCTIHITCKGKTVVRRKMVF